MAELPAPGQFSDDLEKWILRKFRPSVFFVMFSPKKEESKSLKARMQEVNVLSEEEIEDELSTNKHRAGTGFVVAEGDNGLKILTCAHLIDHVFTAKKPISPAVVNKLFAVRVVCDHAEVHCAADRRRSRAYSTATVTDVNCPKDMILLEIAHNRVSRTVSAIGKATPCTNPHPPIRSSLNPEQAEALDQCVMISWPTGKHMTTVEGRVSHWSRTIEVMPGKNENGYSMKLVQVVIRSQNGASGSALLNGQGEFLAMLHGGDVQFSYFVSWSDISEFLERNGIARRV